MNTTTTTTIIHDHHHYLYNVVQRPAVALPLMSTVGVAARTECDQLMSKQTIAKAFLLDR